MAGTMTWFNVCRLAELPDCLMSASAALRAPAKSLCTAHRKFRAPWRPAKSQYPGAVEHIRRGIVTGVAASPVVNRGVDLYETDGVPLEGITCSLGVATLGRRSADDANHDGRSVPREAVGRFQPSVKKPFAPPKLLPHCLEIAQIGRRLVLPLRHG